LQYEAVDDAAASAGHDGDDEQEGDLADFRMGEAEEEDVTTTDGGDRTDGASGNSAAKKKKERKDRKPQKLADTTNEITLVSESGLPLEPEDVAAGYGMQLGCVVRESMSINTKHLRSEANEKLVVNCLQKLHRWYKFPSP
jgi:hypothetical protein